MQSLNDYSILKLNKMKVGIFKNGVLFSTIACGEHKLNYVISYMTDVINELKEKCPNENWELNVSL